ncbi:hypothetical protein [Aureivirga sp. CE67]|uniref:hypothetical protein n=1 Tax=Aureivirga sp. CE67 TaxID=1788983 RepID=UPI0018C9422A|nr:hypothetical protein [Aureivirga sp. CE67]
MRILTLLFAVFFAALFSTFSQNEKTILDEKGNNLEELIPENWKLLESTKGDLNKDNIEDFVFIVQNTEASNFIKNTSGLGEKEIDLNPRVIGIYFGTKNGEFIKELESDHFISLKDNPTMDEPLDGLEISKKGVLNIDFRFWYSAGTWKVKLYTYKFRFQNNEFKMIGYDSSIVRRNLGDFTNYSVNFLTNKMKITEGNYTEEADSETIQWKKIKNEELVSLSSFKKPLDWTIKSL